MGHAATQVQDEMRSRDLTTGHYFIIDILTIATSTHSSIYLIIL